MGFIHETNSQILGFESRSESCVVWEDGKKWDDEPKHIFVGSRTPPKRVQDAIRAILMQAAGKAFSKGDDAEANRLKKAALDVSALKFDDDVAITIVEVSKEWLKELFDFLSKHPEILA